MPPVVAVVPLKALDRAKSRLALDPSARGALAAVMARKVIAACQAVRAIDHVLVVAGDEAAAMLAQEAGAEVLVPTTPGLVAALDAADAELAGRGSAASLVVAADLPLATAADLARVITAGEQSPGPAVVVVATRDGGTGALYRRPPGIIATGYGAHSADRHARKAATAGARVVRLAVPSLSLDVDSLADLDEAAAHDTGVAAWQAEIAAGRLPA